MGLEIIAQKQEELVRKALDGSCFRAPLTADHISAADLFDEDGELLELPAGYSDLGLLSPEGMAFGREVTSTDTPAFGRVSPVRVDVTGDTDTLNITAIETNLTSIELGTGATLLPGSRSAANGSLEIKKPPRPTGKRYHFLSIAEDQSEDGPIYLARYFPKGKINAYGDTAYGGENPIGWPATILGEHDSVWGGPSSWIFGGPGWNALLVKMGFTAYTPTP